MLTQEKKNGGQYATCYYGLFRSINLGSEEIKMGGSMPLICSMQTGANFTVWLQLEEWKWLANGMIAPGPLLVPAANLLAPLQKHTHTRTHKLMNWSKLKHPMSQHTVSPLMPCTYIWYVIILVRDIMPTQEKKGECPTMPCFGSINSGLKEISFQIQAADNYQISQELPLKKNNPPTAAESKD